MKVTTFVGTAIRNGELKISTGAVKRFSSELNCENYGQIFFTNALTSHENIRKAIKKGKRIGGLL